MKLKERETGVRTAQGCAAFLRCAFSNEPKLGLGNWCLGLGTPCAGRTDGSLPVSYYRCQYLQSSAGPLISADVESEKARETEIHIFQAKQGP